MCCGNDGPSFVMTTTGESMTPEAVSRDTNRYRVSYFNGTTEDVVGIEAAQQRLVNPASRAEGTDREGFQGGSYAQV